MQIEEKSVTLHENLRQMKKFLIYTLTILTIAACHKEENEEDNYSERTVLVYMSGENNLSDGIQEDIDEMAEAKLHDKNHVLLVYVDDANKKRLPYLARIRNGVMTDSVSVKDMGISDSDPCSATADVMRSVINYAFRKYPSRNNDYGLVLWGHASGWVVEDSIATKTEQSAAVRSTKDGMHKAYGYDTGQDSNNPAAWINISTMADVLSHVPHLRFIFADCCHFQCLESLYELRNVADYIIGSPAEIPGEGAPYETVTPALFERDSFYTAIVDRYYEEIYDKNCRVPLSVVKTSAMNEVAEATRQVLLSMKDTLSLSDYPDVSGLIHYYYAPLFNDANDFILRYAQPEAYTAWKEALSKAVVYKKMAIKWITNVEWSYTYSDFEMTEERYGGVSMFIPQNPYLRSKYQRYNYNIKKTAWYYAAGLESIGW